MEFPDAVSFVRRLPRHGTFVLPNDQRAQLYGLYKRATCGRCKDTGRPRPGMLDVVDRTKWNAWNEFGGISADEAKRLYCQKIDKFRRQYSEGNEFRTNLRK